MKRRRRRQGEVRGAIRADNEDPSGGLRTQRVAAQWIK